MVYNTEAEREADRFAESGFEQDVAYIHAQGVAPMGLYFRGSMVEDLIRRGVISQCDDCGSEDPENPAYAINGDDDEQETNFLIVARYEVEGP